LRDIPQDFAQRAGEFQKVAKGSPVHEPLESCSSEGFRNLAHVLDLGR
jgi:hypothetical protein